MRTPAHTDGFTLVEVLVVASITVFITGLLVANFSRSRTDLNQAALTVADAVREAQSLTLAGSLVKGTHRCGFGIHFMTDSFLIYAGANADDPGVDCSASDKNYNAGTDPVVRTAYLPSAVVEYAPPFSDIFFEPPDPVTYLGGLNTPGLAVDVVVRRKGASCATKTDTDCRFTHVTTSGQIQ